MGDREKWPKKGDLLGYSNSILLSYWPKIMKKLGLDQEAFDYPRIRFCKGDSNFSPDFLDGISINYNLVLRGYREKEFDFRGLTVPYESFCIEDIIHETIHYVHENFHSVHESGFNCTIEGMARYISLDLLVQDKEYINPAIKIADMYKKAGTEYKNCFELPEKYNEYIKEALLDPDYEPISWKEHAGGFVYLCKYYNPGEGNMIELLLNPFTDQECFEDLEMC